MSRVVFLATALGVGLLPFAGCSYTSDITFGGGGGTGNGVDPAVDDVLPANCRNGVLDGNESDVDCGIGCAPCAPGKRCNAVEDCSSRVCGADATCQEPSYFDGVKNGSETGVDCGGAETAPKCPAGEACRVPRDCVDAVCTDNECFPAGAGDGVKNGSETDVDCGGPEAPQCADGKGCALGRDCVSTACKIPPGVCVPATALDGIKNGSETDVDCGGPQSGVPRCAPGKTCGDGGDCESLVCSAGRCQTATGVDGVKNGDESDVDCGGQLTGAARCTVGRACRVVDDCQWGCSYENVCVDARSCTRHHGGDTCGPGETPAQGKGADQESCCAVGAPFQAGGSTVYLDKYLATAGRMRAMVERLDGNFRGWMQANRPAGFPAAWDGYLPTNKFDAEQGLGPYGVGERRGCSYADSGQTSARTYDTDADILGSNGQPDRARQVTRELLDEKPLNCVTVYMAAALCAFDGRQLASAAAINGAVGGQAYPWGNAPVPSEGNAATLIDQRMVLFMNGGVNGVFRYLMPATATLENTRAIPAPGRMSAGRGPYGHYDLNGIFLNWVAPGTLIWRHSWEGHMGTGNVDAYGPEAYHAVGFRCMRLQ